jgi:hypothetical protein
MAVAITGTGMIDATAGMVIAVEGVATAITDKVG